MKVTDYQGLITRGMRHIPLGTCSRLRKYGFPWTLSGNTKGELFGALCLLGHGHWWGFRWFWSGRKTMLVETTVGLTATLHVWCIPGVLDSYMFFSFIFHGSVLGLTAVDLRGESWTLAENTAWSWQFLFPIVPIFLLFHLLFFFLVKVFRQLSMA